MLESSIQKQILNYLRSKERVWPVKVIVSNRNGTPDILACVDGRFVAIEVKTPTGRLTKLQKYHIDRIIEAGGVAFVATSVDDVIEKLESLK